MLARFLDAIASDGLVRVGLESPVRDAAAEAALNRWDAAVRCDWPGAAPSLDPTVALWAAEFLYRVCQLLVFRDLPAEAVEQTFNDSRCRPDVRSLTAATLYSVDVVFRFLPSVHGMAKAAAPGDPLTKGLVVLGGAWPLSSVGISGVEVQDVTPILADPGLRRVYVDRILERHDVSRLNHPQVREAVAEALGHHPELSPKIRAALEQAQGESEGVGHPTSALSSPSS